MLLYEIDAFDAFVTSLKSVTIHGQWHARVAKIGDKFFAAFLKFFLGLQGVLWVHCLVFKTTSDSYLMMIEQDGIKRTPYTLSTWLAVHKNSFLERFPKSMKQFSDKKWRVSNGLCRRSDPIRSKSALIG